MCAVGLKLDWPMRSRRTFDCVTFDAATLAHHAAMLEALVLAAQHS